MRQCLLLRKSFPVLTLLSLLGSPDPSLIAQSDSAAEGVAKLRAAIVKTLEAHDLDGAIALYEPDAVFLSPQARFEERSAILALYRSVFQLYQGRIAMTSRRQVASGSIVVEDGTYKETLTELASGKSSDLAGNYSLVARQQSDGAWKIAEIVWTETPPAAAGTK